MSTISSDGRYVHVWDLLTDVPVGETILAERCEKRRELGQGTVAQGCGESG
jgi:hypothetical protein